MAVRFTRSGTNDITDHKDLTGVGKRTHAEIDTYLAEIDKARGTASSLGNRLQSVDVKDAIQDNRIQAIEKADSEQTEKIDGLIEKVEGLEIEQVDHTERIAKIETLIGGGSDINLSEIIDARTDGTGKVYDSLKERLDFMQSKLDSGVNTTSGGFLFQVVLIKGTTIELSVNSSYAVGQNEIEVFRGGVRQLSGEDYVEISTEKIKFTTPLYADEVIVIRKRSRNGDSGTSLSSEHFITNTETRTYTLQEIFNSPYKKLELFYNGLLMANETDFKVQGSEVTLSFTPVVGSLLIFQIVKEQDLAKKFILEETQNTVSGKLLYELRTFKFSPNSLEVYVNGVKQLVNVDYNEISTNKIHFKKSLPIPGAITFVKENSNVIENTDGRGNSYKQVERTNVTASSTTPMKVGIELSRNDAYLRAPVDVLKFKAGRSLSTSTLSNFSSKEAFNFVDETDLDYGSSLKLLTDIEYESRGHIFHSNNDTIYKTEVKQSDVKDTLYDLSIYPNFKSVKTLIYHDGKFKTLKKRASTAKGFDGTKDALAYISRLHDNVEFTIEAWVKTSKLTGTMDIVSSALSNAGFALRLVAGKVRAIVYYSSYSYYADSTFQINADTWTHIAMTFHKENKTISVYVDGSLNKTSAVTNYTPPKTITQVGSKPNSTTSFTSTNYYTGEIGEIRMWDVERTSQQIKDNMYGLEEHWVNSPNLMHWYTMDSKSSNEKDKRGTGVTLTNYGTTNPSRDVWDDKLVEVPSISDPDALTKEAFDTHGFDCTTRPLKSSHNHTPLAELDSDFEVYHFLLSGYSSYVTKVTLSKIPSPKLLVPTVDFKLNEIELIQQVKTSHASYDSVKVKYAVSFDKGATWNTHNGTEFSEIDLTLEAIRDKGMNLSMLQAVPTVDWTALRADNETLRICIYVEMNLYRENINLGSISTYSTGRGTWLSAIKGTQYNYEFNDPYTMTVNLLENGDYKINYGG